MQRQKGTRDGSAAWGWQRAVLVLLGCALLALLLSSEVVGAALQQLLEAAEPIVLEHPVLGGLVFVVLSAASAMLAFFSSAMLVPAAIHGWGTAVTAALLWVGWFLGGAGAFAIGRSLRRPLMRSRALPPWLEAALHGLQPDTRFLVVLLLQLTLPSELPGYLCGAIGIRFRTYAPALALAELPYAVGTVLIGASVVQRERGWLLVLGLVGAAGVLLATRLLRAHLRG